MNMISKENINEVMEKYRDFHDCSLISIYYDIYNQKIEITIKLFWEMNENKEYNRSNNNLKMIFEKVKECNIKENNSWDFIQEAYMKYITTEDSKEMLCFSSDEENPLYYISCENIRFEIINKN